ncbi:MAG: response regulator transcription factor [Chloroflexi bacterium]|mgnify:FL=1|nr:response regulator transcription factor [Chloroflexota bacterium]
MSIGSRTGVRRMVETMCGHWRLLIADDSARTRQSIRALVSTHPAVEGLSEAVDGCEAVALAETWIPDAVLMDIRMPGMDGLEATRMIKARWPHIKVIILSMYGDYEAQALAAGADEFVNKGEPPTRLLQALDAVIGA